MWPLRCRPSSGRYASRPPSRSPHQGHCFRFTRLHRTLSGPSFRDRPGAPGSLSLAVRGHFNGSAISVPRRSPVIFSCQSSFRSSPSGDGDTIHSAGMRCQPLTTNISGLPRDQGLQRLTRSRIQSTRAMIASTTSSVQSIRTPRRCRQRTEHRPCARACRCASSSGPPHPGPGVPRTPAAPPPQRWTAASVSQVRHQFKSGGDVRIVQFVQAVGAFGRLVHFA